MTAETLEEIKALPKADKYYVFSNIFHFVYVDVEPPNDSRYLIGEYPNKGLAIKTQRKVYASM